MYHLYTRILCVCCGEERYVPVYCGNRFCEICSEIRLSRIRHRLEHLIDLARTTSDRDFKHVTLTIRSEGDLAPMVRKLLSGFKKLRNSKLWKTWTIGGAYVVEVTRGPAGWHAHIHSIVQANWIPWREVRDAWLKITGATGVFITSIPSRQAVRYLTKYLSKPNCSNIQLAEINASMKGLRMFSPYGNWHSLNLKYVKPRSKCGGSTNGHDYVLYAAEFGGQFFELRDPIDVMRENLKKPINDPPELIYTPSIMERLLQEAPF